jgi:hypothetical protein
VPSMIHGAIRRDQNAIAMTSAGAKWLEKSGTSSPAPARQCMMASSIEKVAVPEGRRGPWSVERFDLADMPRTGAFGRGAAAAGTYTKLDMPDAASS